MAEQSGQTTSPGTQSREDADLREQCCALLEERKASGPDGEALPTDIEKLIFEAQVLLVCEEIHRGNMTDRRIQQAVLDIRTQKPADILDLVQVRLFEYERYVSRLRNVGTVFQQLIRGDMNRSVTRPAKIT